MGPEPLVSDPMFKSDFLLRLVRFGLVGAAVTACFMGLNWGFAHWLGPDASFLAAYPLAVALHFALSKWWTFADRSKVAGRQVSEYLLMMGTVFLVQAAFFKGLTAGLALRPWLASGVASVLQMALSFAWMQRRIFLGPVRSGTD